MARLWIPACALALAPACSRESAAEWQAPPRLTAAPVPGEVAGLDPAAAGLLERAARELDDAIDRPELWTQLGIAYHAHRQFELARTCYEQRLLRDAEDARTWYTLALVEEELGDPARALAHLARTIRLDPAYPPAHWRTGYLRLALGDLGAAETALQAALALAPHDAAAVVGMARVRMQQGEHDAAIALLEEHVARLPRDTNARFLLGTAYRVAGRMEDAARALAGVVGAEPVREDPWLAEVLGHRQGQRADFLRAVDLLDQGQVERAIALLEELHERRPDDTLIHINLHRAYRMKGDLDRALELLIDASRIEPLQDVIHLHLAGLYRDKARGTAGAPDVALLADGLASAQRACELSPTYAAAHGMRGDILSDLGRDEAATDAYVQAARLDDDSAMWQEKAGRALCRAGRWEEAIPVLRRLDVLQPRAPRVLYLLGAALANAGQLPDAQATLMQARALAPDDAAIATALENVAKKLREAPAAAPEGTSER